MACQQKQVSQSPVVTPPVLVSPPVVDPMPPLDTTEQGLKIGQCSKVSDTRLWSYDSFSSSNQKLVAGLPICMQPEGSACVEALQSTLCQVAGKALRCNYKATYQCYGWAYEKLGKGSYVPLVGATANIFHFAGCIIGMCGPQSEVVTTDANGFYSLKTQTILDSIRIKKEGYVSEACFDYTGTTLLFTEKPQNNWPGYLMLKEKTGCK